MFDFLKDWQREGWHASEDELVLYANGELSTRRSARVRAHLEHCWQCRVYAEENEQIISNVVGFLNRGFTHRLPAPPEGWGRFSARLQHAVDNQPNRPSRLARALASLRQLRPGASVSVRLAGGLAVVLLTFFLIGRFQSVPTVSASQLLQRAAESQSQSRSRVGRPVVYQKLRIRGGGYSFTRTIYRDLADDRLAQFGDTREDQPGRNVPLTPAPAKSEQVGQQLQPLFQSARLDWNDPLSAMAFSAWRSGLNQKQDQVSAVSDGLLAIKTTTEEGPIAEATLTVREADYHPVSEHLVMKDQQQVEIAELAWQVMSLDSLDAAIFGPPASPPATLPATVLSPALPSAAELSEAELQARLALHAIGADLGDDVEIHEDRGHVVIDGLTSTEERKQQLAEALAGIPLAKVSLLTMSEAAAQHPPVRSQARPFVMTVEAAPLLDQRLKQRFADADQRTAFVNDTLALAQDTSARVWALRRLANRYSLAEVAALNQPSKQKLETLLSDHVTALEQDVVRLQSQLDPVLSPASNGPPAVASSATQPAQDWRERIKRVHSSVQTVNEAVKVLLGGAAPDNTVDPEGLEMQLRGTLAELKAELQLLGRHLQKDL